MQSSRISLVKFNSYYDLVQDYLSRVQTVGGLYVGNLCHLCEDSKIEDDSSDFYALREDNISIGSVLLRKNTDSKGLEFQIMRLAPYVGAFSEDEVKNYLCDKDNFEFDLSELLNSGEYFNPSDIFEPIIGLPASPSVIEKLIKVSKDLCTTRLLVASTTDLPEHLVYCRTLEKCEFNLGDKVDEQLVIGQQAGTSLYKNLQYSWIKQTSRHN